MSIKNTGTIARSGGILSAIAKNIKEVNLKGVKRMSISFDPFGDNVKATREFAYYMSARRVTDSNPRCLFKTNIVCDRSAPTVTFDFIPKVIEDHKLKQVKIDASNLSCLELLQLMNKYVTTLAPPEEQVRVVATKATKATKKK